MHRQGRNWVVKGADAEPVFTGLSEAGITGREIARALKVSPATVSKWRRGHTPIPAEILIFLTLMLAEQVQRLSELSSGWGASAETWHGRALGGLDRATDALAEQERRNRRLPGQAVCDGARRFRVWWNAERVVAGLGAAPMPPVAGAAAGV